jgi:hypothetical protein
MRRSSSTWLRRGPPDLALRGGRQPIPCRPSTSCPRLLVSVSSGRAPQNGCRLAEELAKWNNDGPGRAKKQREPRHRTGSGAGDCGGKERSAGRAHMSELLGRTAGSALQAELPPVWLLPKLFGLLLIFFKRDGPKSHPTHSDLWANTGESGGNRFLSFPCLGRGRSTTMSGQPRRSRLLRFPSEFLATVRSEPKSMSDHPGLKPLDSFFACAGSRSPRDNKSMCIG